MNSPFDWLAELEELAARCAHMGITADLAALTIVESYALLLFLRRIVGE